MGHFILIASNYILTWCESNQDFAAWHPHDLISIKTHRCVTKYDNDREEILTCSLQWGEGSAYRGLPILPGVCGSAQRVCRRDTLMGTGVAFKRSSEKEGNPWSRSRHTLSITKATLDHCIKFSSKLFLRLVIARDVLKSKESIIK